MKDFRDGEIGESESLHIQQAGGGAIGTDKLAET